MDQDWRKDQDKKRPENTGTNERKDVARDKLKKTGGKIQQKVGGVTADKAMADKRTEHGFDGKAQARSSQGEQKINNEPRP